MLPSLKVTLPLTRVRIAASLSFPLLQDVKSENIVVTSDGAVKLCDFGLAIDCKVDCPVSRVGTLEFMAPEIVRLKSRSPEELAHLRRARQPLYGALLPARLFSSLAVPSPTVPSPCLAKSQFSPNLPSVGPSGPVCEAPRQLFPLTSLPSPPPTPIPQAPPWTSGPPAALPTSSSTASRSSAATPPPRWSAGSSTSPSRSSRASPQRSRRCPQARRISFRCAGRGRRRRRLRRARKAVLACVRAELELRRVKRCSQAGAAAQVTSFHTASRRLKPSCSFVSLRFESSLPVSQMALVANPSLRATAEELLRYGWVVEPKDAAAAAGAHQRRAGRTASVPSTILAAPAPARQPVEGEEDAGAPRPGSSRDTTGVSEVGAALAAAGLQEGFQEALGRRPPPMPVPEGQEGGGGGSSRPGTPPQNERTRGDQMDVSADSSADGSADHARLVPDHPGLCGPGCPCCRPGAGASAHDILVGQQRAREQRQQHEKQIKREQLYQQERGRQREEQRVQRATASQSAQLQPAPQPSPADGLRGSLDLRAPVRAEKRRGSADRRGSGPEEFVSAWRTANSHRRIGHDAQQQQQQSPEERSDRSQAPPRHEQPPPEKEDSLGSQPPAQKVGRWGRVRRSLSHFSAYIPRLGVDYLWGEGGGRRRRGSGSSGSSGSASGSSSSSSHERGRRAVGDE